MKQFEFWFDFGSPASYLAWTQISKIEADCAAHASYHPMLLGGVFQATGNHSPATIPAKGAYTFTDFDRFARRYGAESGISIPEWRVLAHLAEGGPVSVRDIHARVDMDKSKVSRAAARLEEAGLKADLRAIGPGSAFDIGEHFVIEPVNVTHSVPDAVGLVVTTPSGTLVHSGDFKLDQSPIDGRLTDLARAVEAKYRWQPIGYRAAPFPMWPSITQGVAELIGQISTKPGKFALAGYSQGAIVVGQVLKHTIMDPNGALHHRLPDVTKVVCWGNPMRQEGFAAGDDWIWPTANADTGGIMAWDRLDGLESAPFQMRDYAHQGDMYAANADTALTLVPLDLRDVSNVHLAFQCWCDTEAGFDRGRRGALAAEQGKREQRRGDRCAIRHAG